MKKHLLFYTSVFIILFSQNILAQSLVCTHPQVCSYIRDIVNSQTYSENLIIEAYAEGADPHHSAVPPQQVKQILSAKILFTGPKELRPNIYSIYKRSKAQKFEIKIVDDLKKQYPGSGHSSYAHFWLFKDISCAVRKQIKQALINFSIPINENQICPDLDNLGKLEKRIKAITGKDNIVLILPHDSFSAYLKSLGLKVLTLMREGHHHHVKIETLKKIELFRRKKSYNWFWLVDDLNDNQKYIQKNDKVVKIKLMTNLTSILKTLIREID